MTFEILPRVGGGVVCLTCGCGPTNDLLMEREIAVGFGSAGYKKDGVTVWEEAEAPDAEEYPTVASVETIAKDDPDHDWRIFFYAPLYEAEYQRQGEGIWVLVRKGEGFA